jgi:hypothetical protein
MLVQDNWEIEVSTGKLGATAWTGQLEHDNQGGKTVAGQS